MVPKNQFDKEIRNIVNQLISLYKPEKIILFGSLAKGKVRQGTDIDLFIIKSDVPDLGVDRIRQLDALIKYRPATDLSYIGPRSLSKG